MKSLQTSTSDLKRSRELVVRRALVLSDRLMEDPCRPWFIVEYASILASLAELVGDVLDTLEGYESVERRLTSLETRYSELLYKLKSE